MAVRVKNWTKFQHFKDRRPPWVKLYRDLLDDIEWNRLEGEAAKALVLLWLIASEDDGELPDVETLGFRLRKSDSEVRSLLSKLSHWLEQDDITLISKRYQDDTDRDINVIALARSRETEGETEKEKRRGEPAAVASAPSRKKSLKTAMPEGFVVSERVKTWAAEKGYDRLAEHLDAFRRKASAKGYTYANWDDAFMEAIREDWAKLRGRAANGAAPPPESQRSADPDSRSSIEAEGIAKGIGPWNEVAEQWHVYKARVRGKSNGLDLTQLAAMAAQRGVH